MTSTPPAWLAPQAPGGEPDAPDWRTCAGLTLIQAEELLDWLDGLGCKEREVAVAADGVTVRWRLRRRG
jgi:hypothetical protein